MAVVTQSPCCLVAYGKRFSFRPKKETCYPVGSIPSSSALSRRLPADFQVVLMNNCRHFSTVRAILGVNTVATQESRRSSPKLRRESSCRQRTLACLALQTPHTTKDTTCNGFPVPRTPSAVETIPEGCNSGACGSESRPGKSAPSKGPEDESFQLFHLLDLLRPLIALASAAVLVTSTVVPQSMAATQVLNSNLKYTSTPSTELPGSALNSSFSSWSQSSAAVSAPELTAGEEEAGGPVVPEELVLEAWGVVKDTFLDARGSGWTEEKWEAARGLALKRGVRSLPEARSVVSTMIASLKDPYSRYLTPDQFARLAKYDITGVGLNIGDLPGPDARRRPVVVGIVLESPAYKVGIRQGDELIAVDGQDVTKMSSFDVASLIQGAKDTPVSLTIARPNGKAPGGSNCTTSGLCSFTVTRASEAPASPVMYRLEKRKMTPLRGSDEEESTMVTGYVRVKEFNAVAKRDLAEAVRRLQGLGAQALVLDLQDNPGGLVQAGVESAKLFLSEGDTVVYTRARGGAASERGVVASMPPLTNIPLTVLVNGKTASASEIVAAALHDNCRAVLVGSTTYGKGLIQSVYELQDGSGLILTVGKYVTPAHQDIDGNGIKPDFRRTPGMDIAQHRLQTCRQQMLVN